MKQKTHRLMAALCVLCMLLNSMPVSVRAHSSAATPTDLAPAAEQQQETAEAQEEQQQETTEAQEEQAPDPEQETEADRELVIEDHATISGTLAGTAEKDYLIRFRTEKNRSLDLTLTSEKELQATVTDERTESTTALKRDNEAEAGQHSLVLTDYAASRGRSYLIRISGREQTNFTLQIAEKTEQETDPEQEEPAESPEETPEEAPEETPAEGTEEPDDEQTAEPEETPAADPEEEPAADPDEDSAGDPAEEPEEGPEEGPEEEPEEEPENEPAEEAPEQTEGEPCNGTGEQPAEEPAAEPQEYCIRAADSPVEARIVFLKENDIPQDAELCVKELTGEERESCRARMASALDCEDESCLRYTKYLRFALFRDGKEIELKTPVRATVTLTDVSEGLEALQAVRFDGEEPTLLYSSRSGEEITFYTDHLAVFVIGNALMPLAARETDLTAVKVLGFSSGTDVSLTAAEAPAVEEGLEVLGTYTVDKNTGASPAEGEDSLWIRAELNGDAELSPLESIGLYKVENGETEVLMEDLAENGEIAELDAEQIAVIRDTGYRHLTLSVSPEGTDEEQTVTLDGMMPKEAEATVTDVTETYTDAGQLTDSAAEEGASARVTLAAYDISISSGEDDYQPDEDRPINVEIVDSRIAADGDLELWHIHDDGTREQITAFTIEEGRITFEATGFSVYVIISHEDETVVSPRVEFHFITDSNPEPEKVEVSGGTDYYIGGWYSFTNKEPANQHTQILKNGESLELIADPGNHQEKYFYGWYIVNAHPVQGQSDEYGIGTTDPSKIYYSWPTAPVSVTFESPITIQESNVSIGDTIHWSINGVSGSGKVDRDGNIHVLLAPVFEKYNFANFMLYPRDIGAEASKTLMTRKMIALGSSSLVEVKISDIQSASTDPIHLIFTGWEYKENENDPDWHYKQTVDYTGAEMKDPGKDGVYLDVNLADTASINLYPKFVQARWLDFFSGVSGSGATYVASKFRESWGFDPENTPSGMAGNISGDRNVFSFLQPPTRDGYEFEGWYAFAVTDPQTGEITNIDDDADVSISYLDYDYNSHTATESMKAVRITDGNGNVTFTGEETVTAGGQVYYLFTGDSEGLKLFDGLDRMTLYARWIPIDTDITIVYWLENAEDSDYIASATKTISTADLTRVLPDTYKSGSLITLDTLKAYDTAISGGDPDSDSEDLIVSHMILDDVGAVPKKADPNSLEAREEIFFKLNDEKTEEKNSYQTVDDQGNITDHHGKLVDGQGTTSFNVYYSRRVFKLVFHIGRDGYFKSAGQQRQDGDNWLEYMYKDDAVTAVLGRAGRGKPSYVPQTAGEQVTMTYDGRTYDSSYVTDSSNILFDYVPGNNANDRNLYIIEAKYGAYIGNRWPSPVNDNFEFNTVTAHQVDNNSNLPKALYIWTAAYPSLYHAISVNRDTPGNANGNNPDINGKYEYMSAELCADRTGNRLINKNQVHHLVAWFGEATNENRYKKYHFLYEKVDGVTLPDDAEVHQGTEYLTYLQTTWSGANTNGEGAGVILDHTYYEEATKSPVPVISNLEPQFQLGTEIEGYQMVYSCYDERKRPDNSNPPKQESHIFFFYTPRQYNLTFMFETGAVEETYYYKQSLAAAEKEAPEKDGYFFDGWYTNEAGEGDRFNFATETMPAEGVVLYPVYKVLQYNVKINPNGGVIDHINYDYPDYYGNKASTFGVTGTGYNTSQATYFTANYGTTVGEYSIKREYIRLTDKEKTPGEATYYNPETEGQEWYYYLNTQLNGIYDGDWGLPANLRNAVYMTEQQLRCYYNFYRKVAADNLGYYTNVNLFSSFDAFAAVYTSYPNRPYRKLKPAERYSFMGWYQVTDTGVASMPFNFNEPVTNDLELRAQWRLDGGYYLTYNPDFIVEDGNGSLVSVTGQMDQWMDPKDPVLQLYADQSPTHILRAPDKVRDDWVFRGWRIVKKTGQKTGIVDGQPKTYDEWSPIQFDGNGNPVYYQPGDNFIIDSNYVSEITSLGSVIHVQAYYEPNSQSARRPEIASLKLDADGGYITKNESTELEQDENLPSPGENGTVLLDAAADQIVFGDIQSNISVHLAQYAVHTQYQDRYNIQVQNYFKHRSAYFLLGFDRDHDDDNIAEFPADSVITVQRTDDEILYAVWERMVYVNFINTTDEDITIDLEGTGSSTVSIVNVATGLFDREKTTSHIVIPARKNGVNGQVKIVLPGAEPGTDEFTATAVNDHIRKKMSVRGEFPAGTEYANMTPSLEVRYGGTVSYKQVLRDDMNGIGIFVTYTEIPVEEVVYDVNGGTWTQPLSPSSEYEHQMGDVYALTRDAIEADPSHSYHPTDPVRDGMIFVGWTEYKDIADHTDFRSRTAVTWGSMTITPDDGSNVLKKIRDNYLWDFDNNPPPYDRTLYAVWSETVTAIFNLTKEGNNKHTWKGPATTSTPGNYVFYRENGSSHTVTYTLMKGEILPRPNDPTNSSWYFLDWVTVANYINTTTGRTVVSRYLYDFDTPLNSDIILYTSWTAKNNCQIRTFTVNTVTEDPLDANEEFTYTITAEDVELRYNNSYGAPVAAFAPVTAKLKHGGHYTVRITTIRETSDNDKHAYTGYDVYAEVIDEDGRILGEGHLLNYRDANQNLINDGREYTYTIRVAQTPVSGYSTNVYRDGNGDPVLTLQHDQFTFTSSQGSRYSPNTNEFAQNENTSATVTFVNRRETFLTITKHVPNDLGDGESDFTFTLESVGAANEERDGTEYAYTKTRNGSPSGSGRITTENGNNTFKLKKNESISIDLPRSKAVVISEDNLGYTTAWSTESGTLTLEPDSSDDAKATFTLTGDAAATVTNNRETKTITVTKSVAQTTTAEPFTFTATVRSSTAPVSGHTVYSDPADSGNDMVTNADGQVTFSLAHNESQELTVPAGTTLVVEEEFLLHYEPGAAMTGESGNTITDGDEAERSFTVTRVTENGTITFTNTPRESPKVTFDVNGGTWTETSAAYTPEAGGTGRYEISAEDIISNSNLYEPADPTRTGMVFIGWTTHEAIATTTTDFSSTAAVTFGSITVTPDADGTVLDKIRSDYLWDFSQDPPYNQTLYAVWSDTVTVTFDLERSGSNLHRWSGPEITNVPGPYAFYRADGSSTVTYTMLKGERVPKPADPLSDQAMTNWFFIRWLIKNGATDKYMYTPEDNLADNTDLVNYAFDFTQRVTEDVTLSTSWTTRVPQVFTFTVENQVSGGDPDEEFEYTIAVSNEKADKSNTLTVVDNPWGSVTTNLKNNERYTVRITVRTIYAWNSNNNFGGTIEVLDRDGKTVKSEQYIRLSTLGKKYYSSSYQLDLAVIQTAKDGYRTSVAVDGDSLEGSVDYQLDQANRSYLFQIRQGKHYSDQVNPYVSGASNSLTIVFSNKGKEPIIAPTGITLRNRPYLWLMAFGLLLLITAGAGYAGRHRAEQHPGRKRGARTEYGSGGDPPKPGTNRRLTIPQVSRLRTKQANGARNDPKGIPRGRGDPDG